LSLESLRAELEEEYTWRMDEIRFFSNQTAKLDDDEEKNKSRRALILMLYAHFEGFCKFTLSVYVNRINDEKIKCKHALPEIVAVSMSKVFNALREPNSKSPLFKNSLPDDNKLHKFAREREFVASYVDFEETIISIPDDVVDTESNLKPVVLRKNLYRLGFDHEEFKDLEGKIDRLLKYRNGIAHGSLRSGITEKDYNELFKSTISIMDKAKFLVFNAIQDKHYLKSAS
jgi:hypothetical protein